MLTFLHALVFAFVCFVFTLCLIVHTGLILPNIFMFLVYFSPQEIRRAERHKTGILDMIQGSQYLVWYFRALGATIGHNVCLYPNGGMCSLSLF